MMGKNPPDKDKVVINGKALSLRNIPFALELRVNYPSPT